jgi:hypothetical protein
VEASADDLVFVAGFELKRDHRTIGLDDTRDALDRPAQGSRGQVADLDVRADGALPGVEQWQDRFPRGVLQEPNQPGRAENRRHVVVCEINRMLRFDHELLLTRRADPGSGFHASLLRASVLCSTARARFRGAKRATRVG